MTPGAPQPQEYGKAGAVAKATQAKKQQQSIVNKQSQSPTTSQAPVKVNPNVAQPVDKKFGNQLRKNEVIRDVKSGAPLGIVVSPFGQGDVKDKVVVQAADGNIVALNPQTEYTVDVYESRLLKKRNSLRGRIKKLSRTRLKEAKPELFEINFNKKEIAVEALDAPVNCGFEAETFFYAIDDNRPSDDVDNMSVSDVEYEFGDLPDGAYSDYNDWLMDKAMDEYLPGYIDDWIEENRDEDGLIQDFMDSGNGPTEDAVEEYKQQFAEEDPNEYENREEDGWDDDNWARDLINEEYEADYEDFLRDIANDDDQLRDDAFNECEGDYSMDDWIGDQWYGMSSFLDDYGYEYYRSGGGVDDVASELNTWVRDNSQFKDYPESGEYGDTYTDTGWAVETDSSIEPDEGAGAELISPVFSSPRQMLTEMKSLFEWSEDNFGTNRTTGLHVTMSWQQPKGQPNKLKMALLLGDEYLLAEFGRLRNSYTKSQYQNVLKHAEGMKRGDANSFKQFEKELSKGISSDKFQSIHFKSAKDSDSDNNLIEFRIAGGEDYNMMYEKVVKACVRYATIMKAGYDENAFRKDYVRAVSRVLRKAQEIDPKKLKDLEVVNHPIIDSAKNIVGKKDYFDVVQYLSRSVEYFQRYQDLSHPDADKKWKQSIKDFKKGTGRDPSWMGEAINEDEITGYIEPDSIAPSKRAQSELKKSQEIFAKAITMLARDIGSGINRGSVSVKDINSFRKYISELGIDGSELERLVLSSIDDIQFLNSEAKDSDKVRLVQAGISKLLKKDVLSTPVFLSQQQLDILLTKLWQYYQHPDSRDNHKKDEIADLLVGLNPANDKEDVIDVLNTLTHQRSKNEFISKARGGGYDTRTKLFQPGKITSPDGVKKVLAFLEPYKGYDHPTSKNHHVNINNDDAYEEVAQRVIVQKMRIRLDHLSDLQNSDPEKYNKIKSQLVKLGTDLINQLRAPDITFDDPDDPERVHGRPWGVGLEPSNWCLSIRNDERVQGTLDFLARAQELGDDDTYNFVPSYDDRIIRDTLSKLPEYYIDKRQRPNLHKQPEVKALVKKNFAAIKKFMTGFDKIFQAEGFVDLKKEIQSKNQLDKRNKDFEKNVRQKALASFNIPSHSFVYFSNGFLNNLREVDQDNKYDTSTEWFNDKVLDHIRNKINRGGMIFVIPSSDWSDADDATNGLELIETFESAKNYFHTWRKKGYKRIISKFTYKYGVSWEDLTDDPDGDGEYEPAKSEHYREFKRLNIEVTQNGDSRKGAPGIKPLISDEELKNPKSGEPINRGSAMMWDQTTDDAEQKRFNAFDWEYYPADVKKYVAQMMKNHTETHGSFQLALDKVLQKILDRELDVDRADLGKPIDRLAQAAGVEDMASDSSNSIASKTNWTNLADYLKIERGVNDQGPNLLKKVYDMYDGNHNWRPEPDPTVCCLPRWAAAIRAADDYIKKNYTVSGGNYFRDGDNVSQMYGGSEPSADTDVTTDDYERMRSKYFNFNTMMMNGIQNYILQPDVNRLVDFLKNEANDEAFKEIVLRSMMREYEAGELPNDFQGHLARGRMLMQSETLRRQNPESVFTKFDKLPLQEQLNILTEVSKKKIDKIKQNNSVAKHSRNMSGAGAHKSAKDYDRKNKRKEINKQLDEASRREKKQFMLANPTIPGIREYSSWAGRDYVFLNPRRWPHDKPVDPRLLGFKMARSGKWYINVSKYMEILPELQNRYTFESVPDNRQLRMINKLLAGHFPASDLRKQMDAYFAIPDPEMLYDFRRVRAEQGDDACLRPVFRNYVKSQMPANMQKQINLNESLTLKEGIRYAVQVGDQRIIHVKSPKEAKEFIKFLKGKGIKKPMKVVSMDIPNKYESVQLDETPQDMVATALKISRADGLIKSITQLSNNADCKNDPIKISRCNQLDARKQKLVQMLDTYKQQLEKEAQATYDEGKFDGEQGFIKFRQEVMRLLTQLATKINGKVDFLVVADDYSEAEIPTTNPNTGKPLNLRDQKKAQTEKQAIESLKNVLFKYFEDPKFAQESGDAVLQDRDKVIDFLTDAANGNILKMEDVIAVGTDPKRPPIESLEEIVRLTAEQNGKQEQFDFYQSLVQQGLMKQTAENTTSGNVGPGELALLLLCAPAEKGERGDLLVDGKEVEIKSGSYGKDADGKSTSGAGGKFNSKFIVKGATAGSNLEKALTDTMEEFGIDFKKTFKEFMKTAHDKPNQTSNYKYNPAKRNLPTISTQQFTDVWNPYFDYLDLEYSQVLKIARDFALCTFETKSETKAHLEVVLEQMDEAFGQKGVFKTMLSRSVKNNTIIGEELRKLLISLQFTSYQYSNEENTKLHDMILYMNKLKSTITTVSDVRDLIRKFDAGQIVAVKDINLTDTQQTAAHSITAGLPLDEV